MKTLRTLKFKNICLPLEGSGAWLKSNVWFFRSDRSQLPRLYPAGLPGKLPSPHLTWGTASAQQPLKGDAVKDSGPLTGHTSMLICTPSPSSYILAFFIWGLQPRSSLGASAKAFLCGQREENLEDSVPDSQHPVLFHSLPSPRQLGCIEMPKPFVGGVSPQQWDKPNISDLGAVLHFMETNGTREDGIFPSFSLLLAPPQ